MPISLGVGRWVGRAAAGRARAGTAGRDAAGRGQTGRAPQPGCRARCAVLYDARDRCVTVGRPGAWAPHTDSWGWARLLRLNSR